MFYSITEIQKDVRQNIDRNQNNAPLIELGDVDTLSVDEIIQGHILDGIKAVYHLAPVQLLDSGNNLSGEIYWQKNNSGRLILPEDFFRLIVFKMSDWERGVYSTITETSPLYMYQSSRYSGIRGNYQNPIVAIIKRPEGNILEFYSSKNEDATIEQCVYLPYPRVYSGGVDICERCYRSIIYMISGLTLLSLKDEQSEKMIEISKEMLRIENGELKL